MGLPFGENCTIVGLFCWSCTTTWRTVRGLHYSRANKKPSCH